MRIDTRQRGDTIVEVLIATAIIALVLTISFATAQRSLMMGRRAQERAEALKVAESQVEILKALASKTDPALNIFDTSASSPTNPRFCVTPTSIINGGCAEGPDNRYNKEITRTDSGEQSTFNVRVYWQRIGDGGTDEVRIVYKLHGGQFGR